MLLSHFSMGPPRDPYSCGCKAVTCQLGKEAYLLVVQMGRTDVNAPGGQLEYPMEVTRATYKLTCMSGGSDISSIVAQQEPDLGLPAISARRPSTETTDPDSGCPSSKPGKIISPVLWEKGAVRPLPTVAGDPDGFVQGINDRGQAVGSSGTCTNIAMHAVLWENDTAFQLPDLGRTGSDAYAINDHSQIVGYVQSPDGTTIFAAIWQNGGVTNLRTLPGDFAAFATGINNRGQVVGSTFDSTFSWSRGFIWQDGVMTDLNKLISKDTNLFIIAASNINERGQISGMATVLTGPDKGKIHAILATPINESVGTSIADVALTRPESVVPANACSHHSQRFGLGRIGQ